MEPPSQLWQSEPRRDQRMKTASLIGATERHPCTGVSRVSLSCIWPSLCEPNLYTSPARYGQQLVVLASLSLRAESDLFVEDARSLPPSSSDAWPCHSLDARHPAMPCFDQCSDYFFSASFVEKCFCALPGPMPWPYGMPRAWKVLSLGAAANERPRHRTSCKWLLSGTAPGHV